jgi:hypothetical protein
MFCIISCEVSDTAAMMKSKSSSMITVCNLVLLDLDFFLKVGFVGESFLFLEGSTSSTGSLGGVMSLVFFLSSFPLVASLSTSSSHPHPGDSEVVSSNVLLRFCTSLVFFLLLVPGVS